jgi:hypothetical protein
MRTFSDFLTESTKTYKFIIRLAGEMPEGFKDDLERSLDKFKLLNLSAGKTTPIQAKPLDFPQLTNCEVNHFEAEVQYPTTPYVLERYLVDCCGVGHSHIIVRGEGDPIEEQQTDEPEDAAPYEAVLTQEDLGGESAQESVGSNRVMELLKELEKARQERDHEPTAGVPTGESEDIPATENAKAVVGG